MPLTSYFANLDEDNTTVVTAVAKSILVHCLLNNVYASPVYVDVAKVSGSSTIYLAYALLLPTIDRQPVSLPIKGLVLENADYIRARAYGASPANAEWDTADWNQLNWNVLTDPTSIGPVVTVPTVDIHLTLST